MALTFNLPKIFLYFSQTENFFRNFNFFYFLIKNQNGQKILQTNIFSKILPYTLMTLCTSFHVKIRISKICIEQKIEKITDFVWFVKIITQRQAYSRNRF